MGASSKESNIYYPALAGGDGERVQTGTSERLREGEVVHGVGGWRQGVNGGGGNEQGRKSEVGGRAGGEDE